MTVHSVLIKTDFEFEICYSFVCNCLIIATPFCGQQGSDVSVDQYVKATNAKYETQKLRLLGTLVACDFFSIKEANVTLR